jgi:hypothetical protein
LRGLRSLLDGQTFCIACVRHEYKLERAIFHGAHIISVPLKDFLLVFISLSFCIFLWYAEMLLTICQAAVMHFVNVGFDMHSAALPYCMGENESVWEKCEQRKTVYIETGIYCKNNGQQREARRNVTIAWSFQLKECGWRDKSYFTPSQAFYNLVKWTDREFYILSFWRFTICYKYHMFSKV